MVVPAQLYLGNQGLLRSPCREQLIGRQDLAINEPIRILKFTVINQYFDRKTQLGPILACKGPSVGNGVSSASDANPSAQ